MRQELAAIRSRVVWLFHYEVTISTTGSALGKSPQSLVNICSCLESLIVVDLSFQETCSKMESSLRQQSLLEDDIPGVDPLEALPPPPHDHDAHTHPGAHSGNGNIELTMAKHWVGEVQSHEP